MSALRVELSCYFYQKESPRCLVTAFTQYACANSKTEMSSSTVLIVFVLFVLLQDAYGGDGKLKIGVKKRVENCELRSKKGDRLHMHYTVKTRTHPSLRALSTTFPQGTLEDGTEFDSSLSRNEPFVFTLGVGQVIQGNLKTPPTLIYMNL